MNQTKKIKFLSTIPSDLYMDLVRNAEDIKKYFQQEWPVDMSTWYSRIKDILNNPFDPKHSPSIGKHNRDSTIRIRIGDLEDLFKQYELLDNESRKTYIDFDLRNDPEIINISDPEEKEHEIAYIQYMERYKPK